MIFLTLLSLTLSIIIINGVEFNLVNQLDTELWVGIQGGRSQDGSEYEHLANGGLKIPPKQQVTVQANQEHWEGRFWPRTGCDPGSNHCETGDCGNKVECAGAGGAPPTTLAEIKLKGDSDLDFYDISLVNGFNLNVYIQPVEGEGDCKKKACVADIIGGCPEELKVTNPQGTPVACNSACDAFRKDEYCCTGEYNDANKCQPSTYSQYFKSQCPDAYTYAYEDRSSLFTCKAQKYDIVFG